MVMAVLRADSSTSNFNFRWLVTMLVCIPIMVLHVGLELVSLMLPKAQFLPSWVPAIAEYAAILTLALWPLTWVEEVQDTWQRNVSGAFTWPTTAWRFGSKV